MKEIFIFEFNMKLERQNIGDVESLKMAEITKNKKTNSKLCFAKQTK